MLASASQGFLHIYPFTLPNEPLTQRLYRRGTEAHGGETTARAAVGTFPLSSDSPRDGSGLVREDLAYRACHQGQGRHLNSQKVRPILEVTYSAWITPHPRAWCFPAVEILHCHAQGFPPQTISHRGGLVRTGLLHLTVTSQSKERTPPLFTRRPPSPRPPHCGPGHRAQWVRSRT